MNTNSETAGTLVMEISSRLERTMKECFNIETEMLQGSREELPNGLIKCSLVVNGAKAEAIRSFLLKFISKSNSLVNN